jgi:hypothetical protein
MFNVLNKETKFKKVFNDLGSEKEIIKENTKATTKDLWRVLSLLESEKKLSFRDLRETCRLNCPSSKLPTGK